MGLMLRSCPCWFGLWEYSVSIRREQTWKRWGFFLCELLEPEGTVQTQQCERQILKEVYAREMGEKVEGRIKRLLTVTGSPP